MVLIAGWGRVGVYDGFAGRAVRRGWLLFSEEGGVGLGAWEGGGVLVLCLPGRFAGGGVFHQRCVCDVGAEV